MAKRLIAALALSALAGLPTAALAIRGAFGVEGPWTKIGDAGVGNDPTFGSGHNIVASGNEIYVVYSSDEYGWNCAIGASCDRQVWLATSFDGGVTFERNTLVSRSQSYGWNGAQLAIGPNLANPGGRRLHVVWGDNTMSEILYSSAPLDPQLGFFSAPVVLSGGVPAQDYARSIAADAVGGVHVVFEGWTDVHYSRSVDGGATFTELGTPLPSVSDGQDPAIAADAAGDVFVVARQYPGLAYWRRLAGEATWTGPVQVNGICTDEPSIAAFDANTVYLSGLLQPGAGIPAVASTVQGGLTSMDWTVATVGAGQCYGDVKPIAVDGTGAVGVAWIANDPITRARTVNFSRSTTQGASWSAPLPAFTLGNADSRDVNLAFDPAGKALLDLSRDWAIIFTKER